MTQQEYKHNYQHPSSVNRQMDPNQSRCGLCDCIIILCLNSGIVSSLYNNNVKQFFMTENTVLIS